MIVEELAKEIKVAYIKYIENELSKACQESVPESIILAALANILIRRCQNSDVPKSHFMKLIEEGWEYHKKGLEQ